MAILFNRRCRFRAGVGKLQPVGENLANHLFFMTTS